MTTQVDCPAETDFFAVLTCDDSPTVNWLHHSPDMSLARRRQLTYWYPDLSLTRINDEVQVKQTEVASFPFVRSCESVLLEPSM